MDQLPTDCLSEIIANVDHYLKMRLLNKKIYYLANIRLYISDKYKKIIYYEIIDYLEDIRIINSEKNKKILTVYMLKSIAINVKIVLLPTNQGFRNIIMDKLEELKDFYNDGFKLSRKFKKYSKIIADFIITYSELNSNYYRLI